MPAPCTKYIGGVAGAVVLELTTKMTIQRFQSHCGSNVSLSDNNTVARRIRGYDKMVLYSLSSW